MKRNKLFWGLLIFCAINFAAHLCFYGSLPDVVPTHWGADGQANGWGPKSTVLIMAALPALLDQRTEEEARELCGVLGDCLRTADYWDWTPETLAAALGSYGAYLNA